MPTHIYQPAHKPPSEWDRLLMHSWGNTIAAIAVALGTTLILAGITPDFSPSASMQGTHWALEVSTGATQVLGGVVAVVGLHWRGEVVSTGWHLERVGWLLAGGGWLAYALAVVTEYPGSVFAWAIPASLAIGALLRVCALRAIEKNMRHKLDALAGRAVEGARDDGGTEQ